MCNKRTEAAQGLAAELLRRLVLAWDSDFTKLTPAEYARLKVSSKTRENKALLQKLEKELLALKLRTNDEASMYKNLDIFLPFLPKGIGFEIRLSDNSVFIGNLKSEYLIDAEESIFLNYGEHLPDKWNILGILDFTETDKTESDANNPLTILSACMEKVSSMFFNQENKAKIIPLLIYRELSVQ